MRKLLLLISVVAAVFANSASCALAQATPSPDACNHDARAIKLASLVYPMGVGIAGPRVSDVMIKVTIDASGAVSDATIIEASGYQDFDDAALLAAKSSKYAPKTVNCAPVAATYLFISRFNNPSGTASIIPPPSFAVPDSWVSTPKTLTLPDPSFVFADWSNGEQRLVVIGIPETAAADKRLLMDPQTIFADVHLLGIVPNASFGSKSTSLCDSFETGTLASVDSDGSSPRSIEVLMAHGREARYEVIYWRPKSAPVDDSVAAAMSHFCVPGQI